MRLALGSLAMICATAIAIAFLKYWTPFIMFKMHYDQQERLLDALTSPAMKGPPPSMKRLVFRPRLPPPDLPPEPQVEPEP